MQAVLSLMFSHTPGNAGDKNTALKEPFTAALSETTAKKIFGTTNVIGKSLELNRNSNYNITAVYKDAPGNTQIQTRPASFICYICKTGTGIQSATLKQPGNGTDALPIFIAQRRRSKKG